MENPDGDSLMYSYDGSYLSTVQNFNGEVYVDNTYDNMGRVIHQYAADFGTFDFTYDFDARHNVCTGTDGYRNEIWFDEQGRITKAVDSSGGQEVAYNDLNQITSRTDREGNTTSFEYDGNGNLKTKTDADGYVTTYGYNKIDLVTSINYNGGKQVSYQYNKVGDLVEMTDWTGTTSFEVDLLNRITKATDTKGNVVGYTYDSLGNLTWETNSNNVTTDYKLNNLNQVTEKSSDGWKTHTTFTYDKRGNLIQEQYGKNKKVTNIGTYTYDETNKMVKGVNANAESSSYLYNGLGALVEQTWVIAKNSYGYHDVTAEAAAPIVEEPEAASDSADSPEVPTVSDSTQSEPEAALDEALTESSDPSIMLLSSSKKDNSGKKPSDKPTGNDVKKTSTVVKQFVVDYTTETFEPLMEHEVNGLDYRYVYGNDRLSVNITGVENGSSKLIENGNQIRLYYHMDYLGTADYLTSPLTGKVESWTHYNEWGEITHNAVLKCGQRELDLVKRYATHDFDAVLNLYYAKARFYDAENRRFAAQDMATDGYNWYIYCSDNPLRYVDIEGLAYEMYIVKKGEDSNTTLAHGILENTKLARKGLFAVREVADIVDSASSFSADVEYIEDTNEVELTLKKNGLKTKFYVSIDDMDKGWGEGRAVAARSGGSTIYFSFYNCVFADDITYVNIADVADFLDVYIVAQQQNNPMQPKSEGRTQALGVGAVTELKWRLALSAGVIWDSTWDIGLMGSVSFGAGTVGLGLSAFYARYSTPTMNNVAGVSYEIGGSIDSGVPIILFGIPFTLGGGYDLSNSLDGNVSGHIYSANANVAGLPGDIPKWEAHGQVSVTGVINVSAGVKWLLGVLLGSSNEQEIDERVYGA